jgi:hypothetical protein
VTLDRAIFELDHMLRERGHLMTFGTDYDGTIIYVFHPESLDAVPARWGPFEVRVVPLSTMSHRQFTEPRR